MQQNFSTDPMQAYTDALLIQNQLPSLSLDDPFTVHRLGKPEGLKALLAPNLAVRALGHEAMYATAIHPAAAAHQYDQIKIFFNDNDNEEARD